MCQRVKSDSMVVMTSNLTATGPDTVTITAPPRPDTPRVHVARLDGHRLRALGPGLLVSQNLVLLPLTMSGPLRPRDGVVVLPRAVCDIGEAIVVRRVLRSDVGRALGLTLERPLYGPCVAEPDDEDEAASWLDGCLAALDDPGVELLVQPTVEFEFHARATALTVRTGVRTAGASKPKPKKNCSFVEKYVFKTCK